MAADYNTVPRGVANSGAAVVFGDNTGLGALRYLQQTEKVREALQERARKNDEQAQQAAYKEYLQRSQLSTKGGVHFRPRLKERAEDTHHKMTAIAVDRNLSETEKSTQLAALRDAYDREAAASEQADNYIADLTQKVTSDPRYDREQTRQRLFKTLYGTDGKPLNPLDYDPRATDAALNTGREFLNGVQVMKTFAAAEPTADQVSYNVEALPGGRGTRRTASSNFYELTPTGEVLRDTKTNLPVIWASAESLAHFLRDPLQKQYLDSYEIDHQRELAATLEKMSRYEPLTMEETETVRREQSPDGRKMELFKKLLAEQAYERTSTTITHQPALRKPAAAGSKPKFTVTGGEDYAPELMGGRGAGGTRGFLALASGAPLKRQKSDGSTEDFVAKNAVHRRYIVLQDGQPAEIVENNASPQELAYLKNQLYLTTATGNVITPGDSSLLAAYERGDRQPLLSWLRAERERDPKLKFSWHFLATPSKLNVGGNADRIYQRLRAGRTQIPGEPGYKNDDTLRSIAQKQAEEQPATLLVPYQGSDRIAIDAATNYTLRGAKQRQRMQKELDYFNRETTPWPQNQRAAAPSTGGLYTPRATAPTTKPKPAAARPTSSPKAASANAGLY